MFVMFFLIPCEILPFCSVLPTKWEEETGEWGDDKKGGMRQISDVKVINLTHYTGVTRVES